MASGAARRGRSWQAGCSFLAVESGTIGGVRVGRRWPCGARCQGGPRSSGRVWLTSCDQPARGQGAAGACAAGGGERGGGARVEVGARPAGGTRTASSAQPGGSWWPASGWRPASSQQPAGAGRAGGRDQRTCRRQPVRAGHAGGYARFTSCLQPSLSRRSLCRGRARPGPLLAEAPTDGGARCQADSRAEVHWARAGLWAACRGGG
mmetsp:Transcript_17828/g.56509  ORF Transcript_17828/g.56509 Transcript_17828/m.56509 type:complete len:207 (+) Transcript_17828:765-1385(+)